MRSDMMEVIVERPRTYRGERARKHAMVWAKPPGLGRNAYALSMRTLGKRELRYLLETSGASSPVSVPR
jgi:hypothetical protein